MADRTAETAALLDRLVRYKGVRAVLRTRAADLAAATAWARPKRARARQSGPRSGQPQIGQL
jgi:hypothetical protein